MDDDGCLFIIGIVIVAAIIFGVVVPFVTAFWPWILTGAAVIGIALGAFAYLSSKKQREQDRKQREQDRIAAEIQRDKDIAYAEQQIALFAKWLTPAMVLMPFCLPYTVGKSSPSFRFPF